MIYLTLYLCMSVYVYGSKMVTVSSDLSRWEGGISQKCSSSCSWFFFSIYLVLKTNKKKKRNSGFIHSKIFVYSLLSRFQNISMAPEMAAIFFFFSMYLNILFYFILSYFFSYFNFGHFLFICVLFNQKINNQRTPSCWFLWLCDSLKNIQKWK